jgi:hypothetical protein
MEFRFVNEHDPVALRRRRLQAQRTQRYRQRQKEKECIEPYSSIIVRNALRFLLLTNHRPERLAHIFPGGNALRFLYHTYKIRKPKTRNASRFRRLTLVEFNLTTPDLKEKKHSLPSSTETHMLIISL